MFALSKILFITSAYKKLVKNVSKEFADLEEILKRRTAQAAWTVGKYVHEHILEYKERAGYGAALYIQLAEDVDRDVSTLQRMTQFYRAYPNSAPGRNLTWGCAEHEQWLEGESPLHNLMGVKCKRLARAATARWRLKEAIANTRLDEQEPNNEAGMARRVSLRLRSLYPSRARAVDSARMRGRSLVLPREVCRASEKDLENREVFLMLCRSQQRA